MATPIDVYRPGNRTIKLQGGNTMIDNSGGLGSSGGAAIGSIIGFFVQRKQDSDNREILRGFGFDDNVLENMSSSALDASVKESVPLEMTGDAIQQASQNITQNRLNNSDYVDANTMQEQIAKGRTAPQGRLQREGSENLRTEDGQQEFDYQYGSANPPSTTVHDANPSVEKVFNPQTDLDFPSEKAIDLNDPSLESRESKKFIRDLDVLSKMLNPDADTAELDDSETYNLDEVGVNATRSSIEGVNVGDGTVREKGQSEVVQDSIEQLTNLQAGRVDKSTILSKLQASAIAGDKAKIDAINAFEIAKLKEQKPTHTSRLNKLTGETERGFSDPKTGVFTPSSTVNDDGSVGRVLVAPTKTITQDNVGPATRKSLDFHQGKIDQNLGFVRRYGQIKVNFDPSFFTTLGRLKQLATTTLDGKFMINPSMKFRKTKEGRQFRRAVALMQSARQLFIEERRASTGVAFSEKEIADLKITNLNVDDYGPEQVMATIDGKLFSLNNEVNLDQNFMKNFKKTGDLFELNKMQREYIQDAKKVKFNPEPIEDLESRIDAQLKAEGKNNGN